MTKVSQADLVVFTQFIANSVDHNIDTGAGKGAFEGLDVIPVLA